MPVQPVVHAQHALPVLPVHPVKTASCMIVMGHVCNCMRQHQCLGIKVNDHCNSRTDGNHNMPGNGLVYNFWTSGCRRLDTLHRIMRGGSSLMKSVPTFSASLMVINSGLSGIDMCLLCVLLQTEYGAAPHIWYKILVRCAASSNCQDTLQHQLAHMRQRLEATGHSTAVDTAFAVGRALRQVSIAEAALAAAHAAVNDTEQQLMRVWEQDTGLQ